jgi:hypothetical protein
MNTPPKMVQKIREMREAAYAELKTAQYASALQAAPPALQAAPPALQAAPPALEHTSTASLTEAQKQALLKRQQAAVHAKQLQAASNNNTINRDAATFAANAIVRDSVERSEDIPNSMRVDGDPLPQSDIATARECMKSKSQSFFSSPYERSTNDKLRQFKSLRHAIVTLQGDNKFLALREVDAIERNIQNVENLDDTGLYADDILCWLSESNKIPGDLEIIASKLAESSTNGYISTLRCNCLKDARNMIDAHLSSGPELVVGESEELESDEDNESEDSDVPPPPKKKAAPVAKKATKKVAPVAKKKVAAKTVIRKRRN